MAQCWVLFLRIVTVCLGLAFYNISFSYENTGALPRALECAREALRSWRVSRPPGHEDIEDAEERVRALEEELADDDDDDYDNDDDSSNDDEGSQKQSEDSTGRRDAAA